VAAFELDNAAVIRTDDYKAWWEALPQEARKYTRQAAKKGIEVPSAVLNNDFAAGIKAMYDETLVRQGRKFWHYGKDCSTRVRGREITSRDKFWNVWSTPIRRDDKTGRRRFTAR
jgi:hypothetical protein